MTADLPEGQEIRDEGPRRPLVLPAGVRLLRNLAYGPDLRQRLDVYLPDKAQGAPVLFLVHGGAWRFGDKAHPPLLENKLARWIPRGVVVVSVNYRLLPAWGPQAQWQDVARALAWAQKEAPAWGGDPRRFIAMGHSAGAHLVVLLAASPAMGQAQGVLPVRGTVALDSAALDLPRIMQAPHWPLYDRAFGADPALWPQWSPVHQLQAPAPPMLAVCSSRRAVACDQARRLAWRGQATGTRVEVVPQDLSHAEINAQLGLPGPYTEAVEGFWRSVDRAFGR
ncbi:MAG: alpha/beta hydrolase [Burkholderiaceae bacterium]|nr:alpha/beta hydrolase [Burkholderiaceae bacterium]